MATSALDYEGYNDVHHFPFSGQEGHSPAGDWAFIPRSADPPSFAQANPQQFRPRNESKLQLSSQSDPICNSFGCTQYLHPSTTHRDPPVDYFVPDFGVDSDIKASLHHMNTLENAYGLKQKKEKKVSEDLKAFGDKVKELKAEGEGAADAEE